jgi:glycosyltransferase involved in cell wall biosynthesis
MRVLILASLSSSLVNFRGPLLKAMVAEGHEVHAAAPTLLEDIATRAQLQSMGVASHDAPFQRTGLNPLSDLRAFVALLGLMGRLRPDVVLGYTIKPVIWGLLAAALARVPHRFALITGLGYAFTGEVSGKRRLVQRMARQLYRRALGRAEKVFFQNPDDAALFRRMRLLRPDAKVVVVNGSGVDLDAFPATPLPASPLRFLLIARLLGDKGIREYFEAARQVRQERPEITFDLVGGEDNNPDAIPAAEVRSWQAEGILTWHGALEDVRPAIAAAHVYVLPSYREGTPRTVLEAMAMGRAIITTDAPGCRETVIEKENGFLVPVRDAGALAAAIRRFAADPTLIARMGKRSREIAEDKYDVRKVSAVMLREMNLLRSNGPSADF